MYTNKVKKIAAVHDLSGQIVYRSYLLYFICIHIFMN